MAEKAKSTNGCKANGRTLTGQGVLGIGCKANGRTLTGQGVLGIGCKNPRSLNLDSR
jgi:hypothetical protein